jgi:hypothetical protein
MTRAPMRDPLAGHLITSQNPIAHGPIETAGKHTQKAE